MGESLADLVTEFKIRLNTILWEMAPENSTLGELEPIAAEATQKFEKLIYKYLDDYKGGDV